MNQSISRFVDPIGQRSQDGRGIRLIKVDRISVAKANRVCSVPAYQFRVKSIKISHKLSKVDILCQGQPQCHLLIYHELLVSELDCPAYPAYQIAEILLSLIGESG